MEFRDLGVADTQTHNQLNTNLQNRQYKIKSMKCKCKNIKKCERIKKQTQQCRDKDKVNYLGPVCD